jgi:putative DNA primase/helicase
MADRGPARTWQYLAFWESGRIAPEETLANLPASDLDAALLIAGERRDELHYAADSGEWHIWDGRCHARDGSGLIGRLVSEWGVRAQLAYEAAQTRVSEREMMAAGPGSTEAQIRAAVAAAMKPYEGRAKYIAGLRRSAGHGSLLKMMASVRGTADEDLDERHASWLNVLDGTIDLATGLIKPHDPRDMITYCLPYRYNPEAQCPGFCRMLLRVCGGDTDVARYLLTVLGYALLGNNPDRRIIFLNGPTSSGKSELLNIVRAILGQLAHNSQASLITLTRHGRNARVMNSVRGRRLVTITETSAFMTIDEGQVKMITGERQIAVDQHYAKREIVTPVTWLIIVATNQMPNLTDFDAAMRERLAVIPCGQPIPEHERDKYLAERLVAEEGEGILALLIRACGRYFREGLVMPLSVAMETDRYRAEQNTAEEFLADTTMPVSWVMPGGAVAAIPQADLYAGYVKWSSGARLGKIQFNERVAAHPGITHNKEQRRFEGICWKPGVVYENGQNPRSS